MVGSRARRRTKNPNRRRIRFQALEPRLLLRANIGSIELAADEDIGPHDESAEDHSEHDHDDIDSVLDSLPGVGESAGAANIGDGSIGAVGQIPTALYDPNNLPLSAAGLPELESLPNASVAIFLDFDGHGSNLPFDVDGDNTTFNSTEQGRIWETWRQVSAFFSPFDANVTTIEPDFANVPTNYELISNSISGGFSYLQFPTDFPRGFNQSGDAPNRASGIIHEVGHNFGLHHQSDFGPDGVETRDYSWGDSNLEVPTLALTLAAASIVCTSGTPATHRTFKTMCCTFNHAFLNTQQTGETGFAAMTMGRTRQAQHH